MSRRLQPETVLRGHSGEAQSLAFTHGQQLLVSGDSAGVVRVWDLQTARSCTVVQAHSEDAGVLQVRVHRQDVLTQGRDGEISLWDLASASSLRRIRSVFHSDSYHFCKCCITSGQNFGALPAHAVATAGVNNKGAQLVDWRDGGPVMQCHSKDDHGISMCMNAPGAEQPVLLAGTEDGHVSCWDLRQPSQELVCLKVADEPTFAMDCAGFLPRSTGNRPLPANSESANAQPAAERHAFKLICGGAYRSIVWLEVDVALGRMGLATKAEIPEEGVGDMAVRPDNRIVAAGCWDSCIRLYHVRTGKKVAVLKQHRASVAAVEFAPDGMLACASRDRSISLWEIAT